MFHKIEKERKKKRKKDAALKEYCVHSTHKQSIQKYKSLI